jgi:hypothetical protein
MSRKFKSLLNLTTLAADPIGSEGDVFFNTTDKALKIHNGTVWVTIASNTDPTPFYMHTHTYDGEVHTIDLKNPVLFTNINNEEPSTVIEELPIVDSIEGGTPTSLQDETPTLFELTLFDGGQI